MKAWWSGFGSGLLVGFTLGGLVIALATEVWWP